MGSVVAIAVFTLLWGGVGLAIASFAGLHGYPRLAYRAYFIGMGVPGGFLLAGLGLPVDVALVVSLVSLAGLLLFIEFGVSAWAGSTLFDPLVDRAAWKEQRRQPRMKSAMRSRTFGVGALAFAVLPVWGFSSLPFALVGLLGGSRVLIHAESGSEQQDYAKVGVVCAAASLVVSTLYVAALISLASDV